MMSPPCIDSSEMMNSGASLPQVEHDASELSLAAQYAPVIRFDRYEPFLPQAVGYTIFTADGDSSSFPRRLELSKAGWPNCKAIEYAIWWDWDITHLYELEHAWVYVADNSQVVHAEASWHGGFEPALLDGRVPLDGHRLVIYSQPGKHAFSVRPEVFLERQDLVIDRCGPGAGKDGLLITPLFAGILKKTDEADTLASDYLRSKAFRPSFEFDQEFHIGPEILIPWPVMWEWIPRRIEWCIGQLRHTRHQ